MSPQLILKFYQTFLHFLKRTNFNILTVSTIIRHDHKYDLHAFILFTYYIVTILMLMYI